MYSGTPHSRHHYSNTLYTIRWFSVRWLGRNPPWSSGCVLCREGARRSCSFFQDDSHQHDARPSHDHCKGRRDAKTAYQLCTLFLYSHFLQQTETLLFPVETKSLNSQLPISKPHAQLPSRSCPFSTLPPCEILSNSPFIFRIHNIHAAAPSPLPVLASSKEENYMFCRFQFSPIVSSLPLRTWIWISIVDQPVCMCISSLVRFSEHMSAPATLIISRTKNTTQIPTHKLINNITHVYIVLVTLDLPDTIHPIDDYLAVS